MCRKPSWRTEPRVAQPEHVGPTVLNQGRAPKPAQREPSVNHNRRAGGTSIDLVRVPSPLGPCPPPACEVAPQRIMSTQGMRAGAGWAPRSSRTPGQPVAARRRRRLRDRCTPPSASAQPPRSPATSPAQYPAAAYSRSPTASRAVALSGNNSHRMSRPWRKVQTCAHRRSKGMPLAPSAPSFLHDEDDARPGIDELLGIESILVPGSPIVPTARDDLLAPDYAARDVRELDLRWDLPNDVFVKQSPEGLRASSDAAQPPRSPAPSPAQYPVARQLRSPTASRACGRS